MTRMVRTLALAAALTIAVSSAASAQPMRSGFNGSTLAGNDDGSTGLIDIGFTLNFFGSSYNNAYLNNNGNITFSYALGTYTPFPIVGNGLSMIAPFFADVDTRTGNLMAYGGGAVDGHNAFGVTWNAVCFFSANCYTTNSFQLVLIDRSDFSAGDFDIEFNYNDINWETGSASGGNAYGLGGSCARAGWTNGDTVSVHSYELPGSGACGELLDGGVNSLTGHTNAGLAGRYVYQVRNGEIDVEPPISAVPEPMSMLLLGTGLLGVAAVRRRGKKDHDA